MDPLAWVCKQLEEAEPDLLRAMVSAFADALMGAEVDAVSNAAYNQRTSERANSRNGYRERPGTLGPARSMSASPSCARGSYFCDWLIEPRRRAEQALVQVVADFYLAGVSTRRVDKLVKTLGIEGISKSRSPSSPRVSILRSLGFGTGRSIRALRLSVVRGPRGQVPRGHRIQKRLLRNRHGSQLRRPQRGPGPGPRQQRRRRLVAGILRGLKATRLRLVQTRSLGFA